MASQMGGEVMLVSVADALKQFSVQSTLKMNEAHIFRKSSKKTYNIYEKQLSLWCSKLSMTARPCSLQSKNRKLG